MAAPAAELVCDVEPERHELRGEAEAHVEDHRRHNGLEGKGGASDEADSHLRIGEDPRGAAGMRLVRSCGRGCLRCLTSMLGRDRANGIGVDAYPPSAFSPILDERA